MLGIRWSDEHQREINYSDRVNRWYYQALENLKDNKFTLLGKPVNLNNPKEVAVVFYLLAQDYELFHEKL